MQVLLAQRPDNDPWWPGFLHSPGVMVIPTDKEDQDFKTVFQRLCSTELQGLLHSEPKFVTNKLLDTGRRGVENANIHWILVAGTPVYGDYFDIENLPENLMDHHRPIIEIAYHDLLENFK